jgi:hypothetical protein
MGCSDLWHQNKNTYLLHDFTKKLSIWIKFAFKNVSHLWAGLSSSLIHCVHREDLGSIPSPGQAPCQVFCISHSLCELWPQSPWTLGSTGQTMHLLIGDLNPFISCPIIRQIVNFVPSRYKTHPVLHLSKPLLSTVDVHTHTHTHAHSTHALHD